MTFLWPLMLLSLFSLPLLAGLYAIQQRRRRRIAAEFTRLGWGGLRAQDQPGRRRHLPPFLFFIGLGLLSIALARPHATVQLPRIEGTIMLAFDVSASMAADDLEPNRIEAAKEAAREFVRQQPPSVLLGVVAFSDSGFAVQAPTSDQEAVLAAIERLEPERGTALANGIYASLSALAVREEAALRFYTDLTPVPTPLPSPVPHGTFSPAVIVLLTDGENNESPDPLEAVQAATERGVRIFTLGIGSADGAPLELEGFTVITRLDEPLLQEIARRSGGEYYNAENEQELQAIYQQIEPAFVIRPDRLEVTSLFAGASILIFLAGAAISLLWFSRAP